jgi:hypothetical protein
LRAGQVPHRGFVVCLPPFSCCEGLAFARLSGFLCCHSRLVQAHPTQQFSGFLCCHSRLVQAHPTQQFFSYSMPILPPNTALSMSLKNPSSVLCSWRTCAWLCKLRQHSSKWSVDGWPLGHLLSRKRPEYGEWPGPSCAHQGCL